MRGRLRSLPRPGPAWSRGFRGGPGRGVIARAPGRQEPSGRSAAATSACDAGNAGQVRAGRRAKPGCAWARGVETAQFSRSERVEDQDAGACAGPVRPARAGERGRSNVRFVQAHRFVAVRRLRLLSGRGRTSSQGRGSPVSSDGGRRFRRSRRGTIWARGRAGHRETRWGRGTFYIRNGKRRAREIPHDPWIAGVKMQYLQGFSSSGLDF